MYSNLYISYILKNSNQNYLPKTYMIPKKIIKMIHPKHPVPSEVFVSFISKNSSKISLASFLSTTGKSNSLFKYEKKSGSSRKYWKYRH